MRIVCILATILAVPVYADTANVKTEALGKFQLDFRFRHELVNQSGISRHARADTVRTRLNFSSRNFNGLTFVIEADGRVETIVELQEIVDRDVGTLTVTGGEFTLVLEGRPITGTISRRDDTLAMDITTGMEWDFGDDGLDEPATFFLEMLRSL